MINPFQDSRFLMRIAILLTTLGMGGAEKLALTLGEAARARGHAVLVLVLGAPVAQEWGTDLTVVHLNLRKNPVSLDRTLRQAAILLHEFHPEVVHSHCFHANLFARLLRLYGLKAPVLNTIHNVNEGGWHRMFLYRLTDPLSLCSIAVCQAAMQRFIRLYAVPRRKIATIANGIFLDSFTPNPERRQLKRNSLKAGRDFVWLCAARLVPAKDHRNLLQAFALLAGEYTVHPGKPAPRLLIAGQGPAAYQDALISLATELRIRSKIHFLGLERDLAALMDAADGFVLSSAWEGMPLVLAEAMAMQKPVVTTSVGGCVELVGQAGQLVPAHKPEALAEAMRATMALSDEHRAVLGQQARKRVEEQFNLDRRLEDWFTLYEQIAASPKTGRSHC